jgi:hypothetical protein
MSKPSKKPDYIIPRTNAEGLALVWTKIRKAELARQLGVSRMSPSKWKKAVPVERVNDVARIIGIPRAHLLPEIFG